MRTEANKAVVRRFFEDAWNRNQVSELEEYIAADRIHHYGARVAREGVDVLRAVIRNWRGAMPDYRCYIEDMIAEGDRVAMLLRFTGTQTGPFEVASRKLLRAMRRLMKRKFSLCVSPRVRLSNLGQPGTGSVYWSSSARSQNPRKTKIGADLRRWE